MRKGNIIAGLICAALAVYVIVTCLGYPRAEAYGTGVPGPDSGRGSSRPSSDLLRRPYRRYLDDEERPVPGASDVDTGYKTCIHFHSDPACIHAGIIYTWIYHSVSDHAVRVLPVVS